MRQLRVLGSGKGLLAGGITTAGGGAEITRRGRKASRGAETTIALFLEQPVLRELTTEPQKDMNPSQGQRFVT